MRKLKIIRLEQAKKRKNFLPTLIVSILCWCFLGSIIYFVNPYSFFAIPGFFIVLFLAFLFLFSIIFNSRREGLVISLSLTAFLLLRYFEIGNILNFLLIIGVATAAEIYFIKK